MQLTKWYFFVTLLTSWLSGLSSPNYCINSCRHWDCELESRTPIWNDKDCQFSSWYFWFLLIWNMITTKKPLMLKRAITPNNQSRNHHLGFYNSSLTGDFKHEEMIYLNFKNDDRILSSSSLFCIGTLLPNILNIGYSFLLYIFFNLSLAMWYIMFCYLIIQKYLENLKMLIVV